MIVNIKQEEGEEFQAIGFYTIENAEVVLAHITEKTKGKGRVAIAYVPFTTDEDYHECLEARDSGNLVAFLQPDGKAKYFLKDPAWLSVCQPTITTFVNVNSKCKTQAQATPRPQTLYARSNSPN